MAFFDNIKFPFFTLQELNLDWLLNEMKRISGFMPQDGNPGEILTRKSDGAAWEPPEAVNINIDGLPQDSQIMDNDQLIFYDISAQANRKIKPPDLLDSMCSNGTPYMNGTGSAGTSKKPSRYDHVHPTDTSRQAALSGTQMNAVNSGAPANCFSSNKLKIDNGGTGAATASDARDNLEVSRYKQLDSSKLTLFTFRVPSSGSVTITFNDTGYCEGLIFITGSTVSLRETIAFGSTYSGAISGTTEFTGSAYTVTYSDRTITIASSGSTGFAIGTLIDGDIVSIV